MTIDYLAPARAEGVLRAVGTVSGAGRTKASARCDILQVLDDGSERMIATALGTVLATVRRQ